MIFATKETRSALFLVASLAAFLLVHSVAIGDESRPSTPSGSAPAVDTAPTSLQPAAPTKSQADQAQQEWKKRAETEIAKLTDVDAGTSASKTGGKFADKTPSERMGMLLDLSTDKKKQEAMRNAFGELNSSNGLSSFLRASGFSEASISAIVTNGKMVFGEQQGQTFSSDPNAYSKLSKEEVSALNKLGTDKGQLLAVFSKSGFCPECEAKGPGFSQGFRSAWNESGSAQPPGTKLASNASPSCASCNKGGGSPGGAGAGNCSSCGQNGGQGAGQNGGQNGGQGGGQSGGQGQGAPPILPPLPPVAGAVGSSGSSSGGGSSSSGSSSGGDSKGGGSVATIAGPGKIAGSPESSRPKEATPVFISVRKKESKGSNSASLLPDSIIAAEIPKLEKAPNASEVTERKVASTGSETFEGPQAQVPSAVATNASAPSGESAKAFANSFDTSEARSGHGLTRDSE